MDLHLKIIGWLLIILASLHFFFPKYFEWKKECGTLSPINRQMFYVHSFFIALTVFLMGLLCLTNSDELLNTVLGRRICLGLGIFWVARLIIQFFGYSSILWKGKKFETGVHIVFLLFWIYLSTVFILIFSGKEYYIL
jgi:hypothetical protein